MGRTWGSLAVENWSSLGDPCKPSLATGPNPFAAMREEALVADRAGLGVEYLCHTGIEQLFVGDRAQVDQSAVTVGAGEGCVNLLTDFVAAGAGTRADHRHYFSPPANLAQSSAPSWSTPAASPRQPA